MNELFIPLAIPNTGSLESEAINEALASGFVSSVGPAVDQFEQRFAEIVGAKHAIACSSGTAAIHVALKVVGVSRGDEVFCSDFTFVGSGNPIAYLGALPVFVDSEMTTWNLDPHIVIEEITRRARAGEKQPAAIEAVHILGQPAQIEELLIVAREFGIPVIEDAAESLGSRWSSGGLDGVSTGAAATIGCFSFNGNKIVTTGGGGMIVTNDDHLALRARHLTTQAKVPAVGYLHDEVGYNYRLTNLAAALGNAQLNRLSEFLGSKRNSAARYDTAFDDLPVVLPPRAEGFESSFWLYSILVSNLDERDALLDHLAAAQIGARALWRPLSAQPSFSGSKTLGDDKNGTQLFERGVSLPSSTQITAGEQDRVIEAVRNFYSA